MPARPTSRCGISSLGLVITCGVLGAIALSWWFAGGRGASAGTIDHDRIVLVERRDLLDAVNASGRVEPVARVAVMSRATGQILAELDREQLEAQVDQDRANLQSAEARLAAAVASVAEAKLGIDNPELAFLERDAARQEQLYERGTASFKRPKLDD